MKLLQFTIRHVQKCLKAFLHAGLVDKSDIIFKLKAPHFTSRIRTRKSMQFKIINQQTPYQGFFKLSVYTVQHELFDGGRSGDVQREIMERGHAVAVLLHDPVSDNVLLVEQFRAGAIRDPDGPWMIEIVAGIVEPGESNTDVARREGQEEAGCTIS